MENLPPPKISLTLRSRTFAHRTDFANKSRTHFLRLARSVSTFLLVVLPEALACFNSTDGPAILFLPARDNAMAIISRAKLR